MKIWILSDIHLRQKDAIGLLKPERFPEADLCVCAGDVTDSARLAVHWLAHVVRPRMPVVYVLGNHEFYDTSVEASLKDARMIAAATEVTFLHDSEAVIEGVRFLGSTLWTDFALYEEGVGGPVLDRARAMTIAKWSMADFANARVTEYVEDGPISRLLRPSDTAAFHEKARKWLGEALRRPHAGPTVVVTHHAPHRGSIALKWAGDNVTPGFVSDLSELVERGGADLWIHGHVHTAFDYMAGDTRVVCNPKGYLMEQTGYDFLKVVEV